MGYLDNIQDKEVKKSFSKALKSINFESGEIFSEDIALIEIRIASLLKTIKVSPDVSKIRAYASEMDTILADLDTVRSVLTEKKIVVPEELTVARVKLINLQARLKNIALSDSAWKDIRVLQADKKGFIESQRDHTHKTDTTTKSLQIRQDSAFTKKQFDTELRTVYNVIARHVTDKRVLMAIAQDLRIIQEGIPEDEEYLRLGL